MSLFRRRLVCFITSLKECQDIVSGDVARGLSVDVFYTDFSEAFDKFVPHNKLVLKQRAYGFENIMPLNRVISFVERNNNL